jgi:hypothetical protein
MGKLCITIGIVLFGWIGWWLGSYFSFTTAYFISFAGSLVGVYVGWRINRDFFE